MRSTKGLTQVAADSEYESDDQNEITLKVKEDKGNICQNNQHKLICIILSVIIVFALCIVVIDLIQLKTTTHNKQISTNDHEEHASVVIANLMQLNKSYDYFNDDQKKQYIQSFNVFDKDNDKSLNESEFKTYFQLQLNNWDMFERIDVNSDDILSFAECVSYLHAINTITEVHIDLLTTITPQIANKYGVEIEENELDTLFLEYAAIFMYLEEFDPDLNGYIHKHNYLSISASNQFVAIDIDKNNEVTADELSIVLYSDVSNNSSWNGKLKHIFGGNYKNVMRSLEKIKATTQTNQLHLSISPFEINKIASNISKDLDANKEHICYRNNYCYYSYFGKDTKDNKHIYHTPIEYEKIDAIYPNDELTEKENQRIQEAENVCNKQKCCREDDNKINIDQLSKCTTYGYLQCLSTENECVWDCLLPQNNDTNNVYYQRIFKGIDRHMSHKIIHPQITKDKEEATMNVINMQYLSLDVMDSCGTVYEYQLTDDAIDAMEKEYDNEESANGDDGTEHRRLRGIQNSYSHSKSGDMDESTRRKLAVMGRDGRVGITWFARPWSKNVYIIFGTSEGLSRCSGALISARHVLTAGHCVSDGNGNYYTNFEIYPSYNAGNTRTYFGASQVVAFRGWHFWSDYNWDLAIITLDTANTGYGYFAFGYNQNISASDWFGVNGYPSDKGKILQHQWVQMDEEISLNLFLTRTGDIVGGNSGGPAWYYPSQIIYGVVSHETYSGWLPRVYLHNGIARITPGKYRAICGYLARFNETIDHCVDD